MLVLVVDGELLVVDGSCSEISLLDAVPYIYIQYSSFSSPLVAANDLARQLPRAALALARTIPLGLVV